MQLLLIWLVSAVALIVTARLVPGFEIRNFGTALLVALVVGLFNAVLWPVLMLLTLPVNLLTLGLFSFVISAALLKLSAAFVSDFRIDGWVPAIIGAVVLALLQAIFSSILSLG